MARPRQFESDAVEAALLDVFWRRGYARTSIGDLSQATGLLRGSLYGAFGNKDAMFQLAMRRYGAEFAASIATSRTGLDGAQHVLERVVETTLADPDRRGCLLLNAIPEAHAMSAQARDQLQAGLRAMRGLYRRFLREAQAEAGTDLDLDPLAAMLFASSVSVRVLGRAGQDRQLLEDIARGAIEAARRCFVANPSRRKRHAPPHQE